MAEIQKQPINTPPKSTTIKFLSITKNEFKKFVEDSCNNRSELEATKKETVNRLAEINKEIQKMKIDQNNVTNSLKEQLNAQENQLNTSLTEYSKN